MSTNTTLHHPKTAEDRTYPAERAYESDEVRSENPSVGWLEMLHIMHCETPNIDDSEVTSS